MGASPRESSFASGLATGWDRLAPLPLRALPVRLCWIPSASSPAKPPGELGASLRRPGLCDARGSIRRKLAATSDLRRAWGGGASRSGETLGAPEAVSPKGNRGPARFKVYSRRVNANELRPPSCHANPDDIWASHPAPPGEPPRRTDSGSGPAPSCGGAGAPSHARPAPCRPCRVSTAAGALEVVTLCPASSSRPGISGARDLRRGLQLFLQSAASIKRYRYGA